MHVNTVPLQLYKQIIAPIKNEPRYRSHGTHSTSFFVTSLIHYTLHWHNITGEFKIKKQVFEIWNGTRHARRRGPRSVYSCEQPRSTDASTNALGRTGQRRRLSAATTPHSYELTTIAQTMDGETLAVIKLLSGLRRWSRRTQTTLISPHYLVHPIDIKMSVGFIQRHTKPVIWCFICII